MEDLYQKLKAYADEEDSGDTDYLMALLDGAVEEVMHERHPWDFASEEEREKIRSWALLNHRCYQLPPRSCSSRLYCHR